MTDNQKNIIATILVNISAIKKPIPEEQITGLVDMYDQANSMGFGTPRLSEKERKEVITELHTVLQIKIDRGHFVKEGDHAPWYMAAKANNPSKFWDRYRLYLIKNT